MSALLDFVDTAKLSELTKTQYASKAVKLMKLFDKGLKTIITDAEASIKKLKETYPNEKTLKSYLSFIQTIFKYNPDFKETHEDDFKIWDTAFKSSADNVMDKIKENKPTDKQRDGFVPYDEFKKKLTSLPKASDDRLIVALYGLTPPLRADFNDVAIYTRKPSGKVAQKNYIVLSSTKKNGTLYLNEYKTSKTYGQLVRPFGSNLYAEIVDSLKAHPREFLFQNKHGEPYDANTFQKYVNRRLKAIFGKPLTISLIRHAFINTMDFNKMSIKEREDLAHEMGHSMDVQTTYRLIF